MAELLGRMDALIDAAVAAFHQRRSRDIYRVLVLDGAVLKRKTGARWSVWGPLPQPDRAGPQG